MESKKPTLLQQLKVRALISQPFFATFIYRIPIVEDQSCQTAYTNGKVIGYNPTFFNSLPFYQAFAVIVHEILHIAFFHHARLFGRNPKRWNIATDFAINLILVENGFTLPDGTLLDFQFKGMSAEEIYGLLPKGIEETLSGLSLSIKGGKETEISTGNGRLPVFLGEVTSADYDSMDEFETHTSNLKSLLAEAVQTAKVMGGLPLGMDRFISAVYRATMDWKEVLASFLTEQFKADYNFSKPNKRFLHTGLVMPGRSTINRGRFVMAVDTSGSICQRRLQEVSGEIMDILTLSSENLHVLYFDTEVANVQELESGSLENLDAKGGGGTSYIAPIHYVNNEFEDAQVMILFTDGFCSLFASEPTYPVLWVTDNLDFNPPYGEIVFIQHAA